MLDATDLAGPHFGPLSLRLAVGEILCLTGPSGAGKSLTLRALADLDPNDGRVRLAGEDREAMPAHEWRRRVAYLPAESAWWAERVAEHFPGAADANALASLGFAPEAAGWEIARLSSGERQRLGLLRLLALSPRVLLLDEPTANLDAEATRRVEGLVTGYLREAEAASLWVSHDAAQHERLGARVLRLENGRLAP